MVPNQAQIFRSLITMLVITMIAACTGGNKSGNSENANDSKAFEKVSGDIIVGEIDKVIHELPPPSEVPYLLQQTGADLNIELVNKIERVDDYLTSNDKSALNLGVYASDVGYYASYEQVQDALKYLEGAQKLAEKIGVASVFDVNMIERFETNLSNRDSMNAIIDEAMAIAEKRLENNDRLVMVALVLAGSFVEGMYLSTQVVETYPDILTKQQTDLILEPLIRIIIEQKPALLDLIALLKDLPQDEIIGRMISELSVLRFLYDDLSDIEFKIKENHADLTLSKDMIADITTEVKRIRMDITK